MSNFPCLTAFSAELIIRFENETLKESWQNAIKDLFNNIGTQCKDAGALLIGHIKGFLSFGTDSYYCYFSYVDNNQGISCKEKLKDNLMEGILDFNVLVYGIDKNKVDNIVYNSVQLLQNSLNCKCILNPSK